MNTPIKPQRGEVRGASRAWNIFRVLLFALISHLTPLTCSATPFFVQLFQSDGTPSTSPIGVSTWPPSDSPFVTYGTNIIYGGNIVTIAPNNNGYASNWLYPGVYRFYLTNLNAAFVAVIPDTTNFLSVANYTTNLPGFAGSGLNSYGIVTNWLGFAPATNSFAGSTNALGYMPATNSNAGIVFAIGFTPATNNYNGITNSLGFAPATNNFIGLTNALGFAPATNSNDGMVFALGFAPATNSYAGITTALGFAPATNSFIGSTNALGYMPATNSNAGILFALGFTPPTNNYNGVTNALGFAPGTNSLAGVVSALGYMPATNSNGGITTALGFAPATNSSGGIISALHYTPRTNDGYVGLSSLAGAANLATNGFSVWVAYKTNDVPGGAFTNLPQGSLMTTTNGGFYVLSNLVWTPK